MAYAEKNAAEKLPVLLVVRKLPCISVLGLPIPIPATHQRTCFSNTETQTIVIGLADLDLR